MEQLTEQQLTEKLQYHYECAKCGSITSKYTKEIPVSCLCGNKKEFKLIAEDILNKELTIKRVNECYESIIESIKYYIDLPEEQYHLLAIWIIGTYVQDSFNTFPYLFLNAMRGSAKTRTLKIIAHLSYLGGGKVQAGINETTLYRTQQGATLILDEIEGIGKKEKGELREYLNAGYKKGVTVSRSKKVKDNKEETYKVEEFHPYRPIAMANIWGMEEVLGDRCITLVLEKSSNSAFTKIIEDYDSNPMIKRTLTILNELKCSLCSVVTKKNYITAWNNYIKSKYSINNNYTNNTNYNNTQTTQTTSDIEMEELFLKMDATDIDGRNLELFLPLMITSLLISKDMFEKTLTIASQIVKKKRTEEISESKDVAVFKFISEQTYYMLNYVQIKELTRKFREYLGEQDDEERWLNDKWMGRALKRLNLIADRRRVATGMQVTLNVVKAKEKAGIYKEEDGE